MDDRVMIGDCRASMREMISQGVKVQMCVTSPPYFGLRDYGVDGQLGLEATPAEYVAEMVEVFGLVRDLLADDGTLWLNLGDSYSSDAKWGGATGGKAAKGIHGLGGGGRGRTSVGLPDKNLIGIPWRVAFALQADGWLLRQDIIWAKPNPMPESVTDRCTKAHEYLFLLSKRGRYYFDAAAIQEPNTWPDHNRFGNKNAEARLVSKLTGNMAPDAPEETNRTGRNKRSVWTIATQPYSEAHFATFPPAMVEPCILAGSRPGDTVLDPFLGSGTTGQVAQALGRRWIGCELNPQYGALIHRRTAQTGMALSAMSEALQP